MTGKNVKKVLSLILAIISIFSVGSIGLEASAADAQVYYKAHCQDYGWLGTVRNGEVGGTTGKSKRMEAITIGISGESGSINYSAHVSEIGWMSNVSNGAVAGTTGRSKQMEAIKIWLSGTIASKYNVQYRVHMAELGWGSWVSNGAVAGTTGQNRRVEAIQIKLVKKSNTSNSSSGNKLHSPVPSGCKFTKQTSDNGWYGYHDINRNVSTSTPVYAIANGTATFKQSYAVIGGKKYLISYGNCVEFKSDDGVYRVIYAHLNRFNGVGQKISSSMTKQLKSSTAKSYGYATGTDICASSVRVSAGQILGYIGTTGNSTGNHLHIEVYKNGTRVNPTTVFSGLT